MLLRQARLDREACRVALRSGKRTVRRMLNSVATCVTIGAVPTSDFTAQITFLPKGRNVRPGPIVGQSLGCALVIDGALYDVRFNLVPGETIALGATAVLEGTFPDPEPALKVLEVGKSFTVWDRGAIGHGIVLKIRGGP